MKLYDGGAIILITIFLMGFGAYRDIKIARRNKQFWKYVEEIQSNNYSEDSYSEIWVEENYPIFKYSEMYEDERGKVYRFSSDKPLKIRKITEEEKRRWYE